MRRHLFVVALVLSTASTTSTDAESASSWQRLRFLIGTWVSSGANERGSADGTTSFTEDLNRHVIVRRSFADYKSGPQAGTRHDDLLVIYREAEQGPARAIYFDSEGHVIHYNITADADNVAVFESGASLAGPRYRLSYTRHGDILDGLFQVAASREDYTTYLTWSSRKQ